MFSFFNVHDFQLALDLFEFCSFYLKDYFFNLHAPNPSRLTSFIFQHRNDSRSLPYPPGPYQGWIQHFLWTSYTHTSPTWILLCGSVTVSVLPHPCPLLTCKPTVGNGYACLFTVLVLFQCTIYTYYYIIHENIFTCITFHLNLWFLNNLLFLM